MLKSSLCNYSGAYLLVVELYQSQTQKHQQPQIIEKIEQLKIVPFTGCVSEMNNIKKMIERH